MATYDFFGRKIGRNNPCPCGSGKKYKYCHGNLLSKTVDARNYDYQEEFKRKTAEIQARDRAYESAHGKGRPIISTQFKDWRIVAVGNELHYGRKDKTRYFPDFLGNYLQSKLGVEWGNNEIAKSFKERHPLLKWYNSMCHFQTRQKPDNDGAYRTPANGAMLSWYRIAYDLYLIKHNAELQEKILRRLRNIDQFQGARFELCATASMIVAGFEIEFEDEGDTSKKHAEFLAKNKTGFEIAVEAKSRHRDGVLEYKLPPRRASQSLSKRVSIEGVLRKALTKNPGCPYFIFIDVNLPYSDETLDGNPWFQEISETVEALQNEWEPEPFPANAIFFCNDPTYHEVEKVPEGNSFWIYVIPIQKPRHPLPDENLTMQVAQAIIQRTNIPNEYPPD